MPEIKNTFTQGKMNKDLDERIIPNGQYRHAMNVQVSTSEGADVGVVQNIMGNNSIENVVPLGFQCVGSIANEKTNKFYWFVKSDFIDAILECSDENEILPIIIDTKANTADAVLKFSDNIITGINIIDDLLLWTDNINEPRRINIDRCKKGNSEDFTSLSSNPYPYHTKLIVDDAIQTERIEVVSNTSFTGPVPTTNPITNTTYDGIYEIEIQNANHLRLGDQLVKRGTYNFPVSQTARKIVEIQGNLITLSTDVFGSSNIAIDDLLVFNREEDLKEEHITVIKKSPLRQLTVGIQSALPGDRDPLFEKIFPRFSYRYKYADGEYSTFAPFTDVVFNSLYGENQDGFFYNEKTAYNTKEPYNAGMRNMIRKITLQDFTSIETPKDVVQVDLLYKQEDSTTVYLLDTIKKEDDEWDLAGSEFDSRYKGSFEINSANIHAALPSDQLLRSWDNVPRKALAQEVTGNRVVYGNYLQNYTNEIPPLMQSSFEERFNHSLELLKPVYSSNLLLNGNFKNSDKGTGYSVSGFLAPDSWILDDGMSYVNTSSENNSVKIENAPQGAILAQSITTDLQLDLKYRISFKLLGENKLISPLQNPGELDGKLIDANGNFIEFSGVKAPYKQISGGSANVNLTRTIDKPKIFQFEAILKDKGVYETDNLSSFYIRVSTEGDNTFQPFKGTISDVSVQVLDLDRSRKSFSLGGFPTIKSQRHYQLGVVYGDKYGRETPVFTSANSSIKVPWKNDNLGQLASRSLQLKTELQSLHPEWADYYKFYIKETSGEYYNLIMDAIYKVTKDDIDKDDHVWISFPSSDRNKISEDDYIILKKKADESIQVEQENKFRVLDVKNEAPDAIKYRYIRLGEIANTGSSVVTSILNSTVSSVGIFYVNGKRPIITTGNPFPKELVIKRSNWEANGGQELINKLDQPDLYFSFTKTTADPNNLGNPDNTSGQKSSKKYKVAAIREDANSDYIIALNEPITEEDSDLIEDTNNAGFIAMDIVVRFEKKITKSPEAFSGRFFVKIISTNQTKNSLESSNVLDLLLNTVVKVQRSVRWLSDVRNTTSFDSDDGLINQEAFINPTDQANEITGHNTSANVTKTPAHWQAILDSKTRNGCFIDNMYFASAQLGAYDYARDSGQGYQGGKPNVPGDISRGIVNTDVTEGRESQWITIPNPAANGGYGEPVERYVSYDNLSYSADFDNFVLSENYKLYRPYKWERYNVDSAIAFPAFNHNKPLEANDGENLVNGIDGFIKTNQNHVSDNGIRRWRSSVHDDTETADGTYTKEIEKNFLHLSFLGPGLNLHDGSLPQELAYSASTPDSGKTLCESLQAIWGGGVFTTEDGTPIGTQAVLDDEIANNTLLTVPGTTLSDGTIITPQATQNKFEIAGDVGNNHAVFMEGDPLQANVLDETDVKIHPKLSNHTKTSYLGYDKGEQLSTTYKFKHENQWRADLQGENGGYGVIARFIENIENYGSFVFKNDPDQEIYTVKSWSKKKLYNHTPWRRTYKWSDSQGKIVDDGTSVETAVVNWALSRNNIDGSVPSPVNTAEGFVMMQKLADFGNRNNRRVCYVIELDKDVTTKTYNPVDGANIDANSYDNIQFIEKDYDLGSKEITQNPAIWETEPKDNVDLDIYYETGQAFPVKITQETQELFAPVGCEVKFIENKNATQGGLYANANLETSIYLSSWIGPNEFTLSQDINDNQTVPITSATQVAAASQIDADPIVYVGKHVRFIRKDGEFTTGVISSVSDNSINTSNTTFAKIDTIKILPDPGIQTGLGWYNSITFGNGIESNRIRDDFNAMTITSGAKASTTLDTDYKEEERKSGLIYSGIYNSTSGTNNLNQFITAEKITKDLNPTYGSIQKLFQRRISLIAFCEDRVVGITANKNALYNADGNPQIVASDAVLGDANPFVGDYGISKNPESFAKESYRAYFTDKQRGAVLRLSMDGLTPISDAGMHDYFKDNLKTANRLIGTYDSNKQDYNLTLSDFLPDNVIFNGFLDQGESAIEYFNLRQYIKNGDFTNGITSTQPQIPENFIQSPDLGGKTRIVNHAAIPFASLQQIQLAITARQWEYTYLPNYPGADYHKIYKVDWSTSNPAEQNPFGTPVSAGSQPGTNLPIRTVPSAVDATSGNVILQGADNINYSAGNAPNQDAGGVPWTAQTIGTGLSIPTRLQYGAAPVSFSGAHPILKRQNTSIWADMSGQINSLYEKPFANANGGVFPLVKDHNPSSNANNAGLNPNIVSDFSTINNSTLFHGEEIRVVMIVEAYKSPFSFVSSPVDLKVELYGQLPGSSIEELIPDSYFNTDTTPGTASDGILATYYGQTNMPSSGYGPGVNPTLINNRSKGFVGSNTFTYSNLPQGSHILEFYVRLEGVNNSHYYNDPSPGFGIPGNHEMRRYITKYLNIHISKTDSSNSNSLHVRSLQIEKIKQLTDPGSLISVPYLPYIPPAHIPEWVEVDHLGINNWQVTAGSSNIILNSANVNKYGLQTGAPVYEPDPNTGTTGPLGYYKPPLPTNNPYYPTVNQTAVYYNGTGAQGSNQYPDATYHEDDSFEVTGPCKISQDLSLANNGTPFIDGHWYEILIHIESGSAPGGTIVVNDVIDPALVGSALPEGYFGTASTGTSAGGLKLVYESSPSNAIGIVQGNGVTIKNNYQRGIWKHGDGTGSNNEVQIYFYQFIGVVDAIEIRDITDTYSTGNFDNWSFAPRKDQSNNTFGPQEHYYHYWTPALTATSSIVEPILGRSFYTPANSNQVYNLNGKVRFENAKWGNHVAQSFSLATGGAGQNRAEDIAASPNVTNDGYELKFVVSNVLAGGSLSGYVMGAKGAIVSGEAKGVEFSGINQDGYYMAKFNTDGTPISFKNYTDASYEVINVSASGQTISEKIISPSLYGHMNKVVFRVPNDPVGFSGTIDNISLKDATNYFQSSTSIGWTFHGYDQLLENYINFDEQNRNIVFENLPRGNGFDAGASLRQSIPNHNFVAGDTVNLRFSLTNHPFQQGVLTGYFYDNNGDGFHIPLISNNGEYDFTFIIGDTTSAGGSYNNLGQISPGVAGFYPRNTLVIYAMSGSGIHNFDFSGTLDNFVLNRVIPGFTPSTITYSEDVKGWVSFKSFIPEAGISLSKDYYTIKDGKVWKHHHNEARNEFYGADMIPSTLTAVLNTEPSLIKIFNTLGYEGSQSKVIKHVNSQTHASGLSNISTHNLIDKDGWAVDYIITDKQQGSVVEFLEKEGKWFNYIKGTENEIPKSSYFSFQGLGIVEYTAQVSTPMPPPPAATPPAQGPAVTPPATPASNPAQGPATSAGGPGTSTGGTGTY